MRKPFIGQSKEMDDPLRVAIRVDASAQIGTGHLRRMLALGIALREVGGEVRFITRSLGLDSNGMIKGAGFEDTVLLGPSGNLFLPDPTVPHAAWAAVSPEQDIENTCDVISDFAPDWMVVDHYAFDARWHSGVRGILGCRLAVIDDLADRALDADLVVDHNYHPDHDAKFAAVIAGKTKLLAGPCYALLGPSYADAARYEFNEEVRSIGIFMGGADAGAHTIDVLDAIETIQFNGSIEVISTSANPGLAALRKRVLARSQTKLSLDLPDLAAFFGRHDLQVGAGGGASWERCCVGVPTLLIVVAENQNSVAPQLSADGIVALAREPTAQAISAELAVLLADVEKRRSLANRSSGIVDGHGALRVAKEMKNF